MSLLTTCLVPKSRLGVPEWVPERAHLPSIPMVLSPPGSDIVFMHDVECEVFIWGNTHTLSFGENAGLGISMLWEGYQHQVGSSPPDFSPQPSHTVKVQAGENLPWAKMPTRSCGSKEPHGPAFLGTWTSLDNSPVCPLLASPWVTRSLPSPLHRPRPPQPCLGLFPQVSIALICSLTPAFNVL